MTTVSSGTVPLHPREATPDDYSHFVMFQRELGLSAPSPREEWVAHHLPRSFFLTTPEGEVVAYAMIKAFGREGDVRQIAVAPGWRGRGVGRQLMQVVAARLRAAGCVTWQLEVKVDNAAGQALYRRVGMTVIGEQHMVHLPWAAIDRLPPPQRRVETQVVTPAEDRALEAAFAHRLGRLADLRTRRPDVAIHRLRDVDAPAEVRVGLARYLPGAFAWPFQVAHRSYAGTLLAAITAGCAPVPHVELCVDSDPALLALLMDLGASHEEHLLVMRGALSAA